MTGRCPFLSISPPMTPQSSRKVSILIHQFVLDTSLEPGRCPFMSITPPWTPRNAWRGAVPALADRSLLLKGGGCISLKITAAYLAWPDSRGNGYYTEQGYKLRPQWEPAAVGVSYEHCFLGGIIDFSICWIAENSFSKWILSNED